MEITLLICSCLLTVTANLIDEKIQYEKNCDDDVPLVTCDRNYCSESSCHAHPYAECRLNLCNTCKPVYYVDGVKVNCNVFGKYKVENNCPIDDIISCYRNPCEKGYCGGYPDAECRVNVCGVCKAVYFINEQPVICSNSITNAPVRSTPSPAVKLAHKIEDDCPLGVPVVACFADPCTIDSCNGYPKAECRVNLCGDCKALFYVNDVEVNCNANSIGQARLSSCVREKKRGDLSRKPYRFVVKCKQNGEYESLQCWPTVGLCWCVNQKGKELLGSRMYFPWKPNCEQLALDCRSKEFGCCPDNITPAKGLHFKGCPGVDYKNCEKTLYGCCRDGKSVARGPHGEGCPREPTKCELSHSQTEINPRVRFKPKCDQEGLYLTIQCLENLGICWCVDSDGREQEGTRTSGRPDCSNAICEDKREDCLVYARVPGFCKKISHYMKEYCRKSCGFCTTQKSGNRHGTYNPPRPGCSSVYGCCKDLVTPAKGINDYLCPLYTSTCHMPKVIGECKGNFERYFYDISTNRCEPFVYGGCRGNENNFESRQECEVKCLEDIEPEVPGQLLLPGEKDKLASGTAGKSRVLNGFELENKESKSDEVLTKHIYSPGCNSAFGCCDDGVTPATGPKLLDCPIFDSYCHMPAATGPCNEYLTRYFFNTKTQNCDAFVYGGCGGNKNTFLTREDCTQKCIYDKKISNEVEIKTIQTSRRNSVEKSSGNEDGTINRVETIVRKTQKPQSDNVESVTTGKSVRPSKPTPVEHSLVDVEQTIVEDRNRKVAKNVELIRGPDFNKLLECEKRLHISKEINRIIVNDDGKVHYPNCSFSGKFSKVQCWKNQGYCWCVDEDGNEIEGTKSSMMPVCPKSLTQKRPCVDRSVKKCAAYGSPAYCKRYKSFMKRTCPHTCGFCSTPVARPGCKSEYGCCDDGVTPKLQKDSSCPRYGDICYMPKNGGRCLGYMERFYYDSASKQCVEFIYGGCDGNKNNFLTKNECEHRCNYDLVRKRLLKSNIANKRSKSTVEPVVKSTTGSSKTLKHGTDSPIVSTKSKSSKKVVTLPNTVSVQDNTPTAIFTTTDQYSTDLSTEDIGFSSVRPTSEINIVEIIATTAEVATDNSIENEFRQTTVKTTKSTNTKATSTTLEPTTTDEVDYTVSTEFHPDLELLTDPAESVSPTSISVTAKPFKETTRIPNRSVPYPTSLKTETSGAASGTTKSKQNKVISLSPVSTASSASKYIIKTTGLPKYKTEIIDSKKSSSKTVENETITSTNLNLTESMMKGKIVTTSKVSLKDTTITLMPIVVTEEQQATEIISDFKTTVPPKRKTDHLTANRTRDINQSVSSPIVVKEELFIVNATKYPFVNATEGKPVSDLNTTMDIPDVITEKVNERPSTDEPSTLPLTNEPSTARPSTAPPSTAIPPTHIPSTNVPAAATESTTTVLLNETVSSSVPTGATYKTGGKATSTTLPVTIPLSKAKESFTDVSNVTVSKKDEEMSSVVPTTRKESTSATDTRIKEKIKDHIMSTIAPITNPRSSSNVKVTNDPGIVAEVTKDKVASTVKATTIIDGLDVKSTEASPKTTLPATLEVDTEYFTSTKFPFSSTPDEEIYSYYPEVYTIAPDVTPTVKFTTPVDDLHMVITKAGSTRPKAEIDTSDFPGDDDTQKTSTKQDSVEQTKMQPTASTPPTVRKIYSQPGKKVTDSGVKLNDACMYQPDRGDCENYLPRYYYNATMKQCILFSYSGCKGNGNNFQTKLECIEKCLLKEEDTHTKAVESISPNTLGCNSVYGCCDDRIFPAKGPNGAGCPKYNSSCEMPTHAGPCRALITRWYYDKHEESCKSFTWGGCDGNDNNFASDIDCYIACDSQYINPPTGHRGTEEDLEIVLYPGCSVGSYGCCRDGISIPTGPNQQGCPHYETECDMPKVSGTCKERLVRYYYDTNKKKCDNFLFSGCGGNMNNFDTIGQCNMKCESGRSSCQDLYSLCSAWKDRGFCESSPDIGSVYCKKTCGKCRNNKY